MPSNIYNIIRNAAENKLQVHANYDWEYRQMCPHIVWIGWQNEERALFCQFWWGSKSKWVITPKTREWRNITLNKLSNITTISGEWHSLNISGKRNKNWYFTQIDFEVSCDLKISDIHF